MYEAFFLKKNYSFRFQRVWWLIQSFIISIFMSKPCWICWISFFTSLFLHFLLLNVLKLKFFFFQFPDRKRSGKSLASSHSGWRQTILQYVEIHFSSSIFHFHALLACLPINKMCVKNKRFPFFSYSLKPIYTTFMYKLYVATTEHIVSLNTYWFVLLLYFF